MRLLLSAVVVVSAACAPPAEVCVDPVAALGAACCEEHGADACTPGAVCALLVEERTISTCFELASRARGETCADTSALCAAGLTCGGPDGGVCLFEGAQVAGDDCIDASECADDLGCEGSICRYPDLGPVGCVSVADCPGVDGLLEVECNEDLDYHAEDRCHSFANGEAGAVCIAEIEGTACPAAYPYFIIEGNAPDSVACAARPICS